MSIYREFALLASILSSGIAVAAAPIQYVDPIGDDKGPGTYTYPAGVVEGSADLCSFAFVQGEEDLQLSVGVRNLTPNTRVAVYLLDQTAFEDPDFYWTIGGTELKIPSWILHGVGFVFGLPAAESELFDYNALKPSPQGDPRPDNVMYVNLVEWAGQDLEPSKDPLNVFRLEPVVNRQADCSTLTYSVPRELLARYLPETMKDESAPLYATAYAYLTVPSPKMEYGAYDLDSSEGGLDSWEDIDAFDVAFFSESKLQESALQSVGSGEAAVVKLKAGAEGWLQVK